MTSFLQRIDDHAKTLGALNADTLRRQVMTAAEHAAHQVLREAGLHDSPFQVACLVLRAIVDEKPGRPDRDKLKTHMADLQAKRLAEKLCQ